MLDLETLGLRPNAAIIQIAAVPFNFETGEYAPPLGTFDEVVDKISSVAYGGTFDNNTIEFWDKLEVSHKELYDYVMSGTQSIHYVLHKLQGFISEHMEENFNLWAHSTFDPVVLTSAYTNANITAPFKHWQPKDLRTLEYLSRCGYKDRPKFIGVQHNALDDCIHQINCAVIWHKAIREKL